MRSFAALLIVAGCSEGGIPPIPQDGGDRIDAAVASADARPVPDAPPGIDATTTTPDAGTTLPPSTANLGWIGGACQGPTDCKYSDPICLTQGFPNGMCTQECNGVCPDRTQPRDTPTACIDGRPFGFDRGVCASRCNPTLLPPTGCAAGYVCLNKNRYLDAAGIRDVCVPAVARGACDAEDEIVSVDYPNKGALWIPREAQCGGSFPLVVQLHGINGGMNPTPDIGGGRHMEYLVRSLIDYGLIKPVLVAAPVHTAAPAASSTGLFSEEYWEPATHLDKLKPALDQRGITLSSISYAGHSGAGCDSGNGLYLVLERYAQLVPAYAPVMKMWGLEDVCYEGSYHYTAPMTTLAGKGTAIINVWTGQSGPAAQTVFENGLIADPAVLACPSAVYSKCINHKVEPWCSYRTAAAANVNHDDNPLFFVREAFPQVFPVDPSIKACR